MPRPEGYRKALRLMRLAEKFKLPIFTFVDTPGAYPGVGAEERGQSEAIGHNLYAIHQHHITHGNSQGPTRAPFTNNGGNDGHIELSHGIQIVSNPRRWDK